MDASTGQSVAVEIQRSKRWFNRAGFLSYGICLAVIAGAIWLWGAVEVRGHAGVVAVLTLLGFFWLVLSTFVFNWFGLSVVEDAVERRNGAALVGFIGAIVGMALIYAAGNLGEGPSYAENFFSAGLGAMGFFVLWLILEIGGKVSKSIAEERDVASGIRLCGFTLAIGLIIARAIAGDWHSASDTVHDFLNDGWLATALCGGAIFIERAFRPTVRVPRGCVSLAVFIAALYLAFAAAWVFHLGRWEGMPR